MSDIVPPVVFRVPTGNGAPVIRIRLAGDPDAAGVRAETGSGLAETRAGVVEKREIPAEGADDPYSDVSHIQEDMERVTGGRLRFRARDVAEAAKTAGVLPELLAAFLRNDSRYGTAGMGARNNNPGNLGQLDHYRRPVRGHANLRKGLAAAAKELAERVAAHRAATGREDWTAEELARGRSRDGIVFSGPYMTDENGPKNVQLIYASLLSSRKAREA